MQQQHNNLVGSCRKCVCVQMAEMTLRTSQSERCASLCPSWSSGVGMQGVTDLGQHHQHPGFPHSVFNC